MNENEFVLLNIDDEINEKKLNYNDAEEIVSEKLYEKINIEDTILLSENKFKNLNSKKLKKISGLKRIDNEKLSKIFNNYIINKIFKTNIGELESIKTTSGILTFKILKENFKSNFDTKIVKQIDNNFRENMLLDIKSYYYKNFEIFHKIKSNFEPLNSLIKPNQ